ncbi:MAG: Chitinase precursor [Bacteroidota bacterium]|jgi:chitinase
MKKVIIIICFILTAKYSVGKKPIVMGYLPDYRWSIVQKLNFDFLTHLIVAFANPDSSGKLSFGENLAPLVKLAHGKNVKVILSIGGGGNFSWGEEHQIYAKLLKTPESRSAFIHKIINFVKLNKLDGVDNDLEGYALALPTYNVFTQELADSLKANQLESSAAYYIGGQWGLDRVAVETLQKLDYILTMSYGGIGDWNWKTKPDDGTLDKLIIDIEHLKKRGVPAKKIIGGFAFYAVEFPKNKPENYFSLYHTACDMFTNFNTYQPLINDTINLPNQNTIYFNSMETFKQKIDFALDNAGGFFIWELGQDCFNKNSLSEKLYDYVKRKKF